MGAAGQSRPPIRFGHFELDVAGHQLRKNGSRIKLQEQPFQILQVLLEQPGEVVTREQLRQKLWPADTFVDFDHSLNTAMKKLRQALADDPDRPRFIETLPKIGYRWILPADPATSSPASPSEPAILPTRLWLLVGALAIAAIALGYGFYRYSRPASLARKIKIAVLPFQNLSGDPRQDFFSDGMTEETIAQLSTVNPSRLGVIARTSALKYKNTTKGADQIGRELNVDYLLEGSIREAEGRVRITAQLIQVDDQTHIWSESFERDLTGLLKLQQDVADAIARKINVNLPVQSSKPVGNDINWEAYSAYLKGRHMLLDTKTEDSTRLAIEYFKHAIEIDPKFALAYAGLADGYSEQADRSLSGDQAFALSRKAASTALQLDPNLAEAHVSLANLLAFHDWKWSEAEKEYKQALDLKPTYEEAHHSYSHYLMAAGRHDEAIAESKRLLELDPLSSHMNAHLGLAYLISGQVDESISQLRKTTLLDPTYIRGYLFLSAAYMQKHMYREAIETAQKAVSLRGNTSEGLTTLAQALIVGGKRAEGMQLLQDLEKRAKREYISPMNFAELYLVMGEQEKALDFLERAYKEHSYEMPYLKVDPAFMALHHNPRFERLVRAVGI